MKLLINTLLILALAGCAGHQTYNPLEGAYTIATPVPTGNIDADMVVIQAELKRIVNSHGITNTSLYWIINDYLTKENRAMYDITITVEGQSHRYLFGLTDGAIGMVKEIELEAEVNCQHEEQKYGGKDQA